MLNLTQFLLVISLVCSFFFVCFLISVASWLNFNLGEKTSDLHKRGKNRKLREAHLSSVLSTFVGSNIQIESWFVERLSFLFSMVWAVVFFVGCTESLFIFNWEVISCHSIRWHKNKEGSLEDLVLLYIFKVCLVWIGVKYGACVNLDSCKDSG